MKALLSRLLDALLGPPTSDVLAPRPRVTPDPQHAAELDRRFAELAYTPESVAFHRDRRQERLQ